MSTKLSKWPATLFLALSPWAAFAATGPYNTGVDATGQPLPVGALDPHWTLLAGPDVGTPRPAVVSSIFNEFPMRSDSTWIWASVNAAAVNAPYKFRTTFILTEQEAISSKLSGTWSVDNVGRIELNGAMPAGSGDLSLMVSLASNYQSFHDFSITGGLVAGLNTLDFIATDFGGVAGLNVAGLTISAVPEPMTVVLHLAGLIALACCRRRVV